MAIKVGRVSFIHTEPFYFDMARRGIELQEMSPSALAPAAESGQIDAGPVPLVDAFRLENDFQPVAGFCTATTETSGSVFLYSTKPIEELDGATIGMIDEARTAPKLLEVLLKLKYGIAPGDYVPLRPAEYDAFVLIGNRALRQRRGARGFPHKYDLGQEWHSWTGLPFVFSRWIARNDMDSKELAPAGRYPVRGTGGRRGRPLPHERTTGRPFDAAPRRGHPSPGYPLLHRLGRAEGH